jgi:Flp pilus assembly protein TadG
MMNLRTAFGAGWPQLCRRRTRGEGGGAAVACASTMPLIVLAAAVAVDYANVARFATRVQLAADAASLAATGSVVRHPDGVGVGAVDELAEQIAAGVFALNAPRGAGGTPPVETRSRASVVSTTVAYQGVAPSNFGPALGYGAISVTATATSLGVVADSRTTSAP